MGGGGGENDPEENFPRAGDGEHQLLLETVEPPEVSRGRGEAGRLNCSPALPPLPFFQGKPWRPAVPRRLRGEGCPQSRGAENACRGRSPPAMGVGRKAKRLPQSLSTKAP